jgi:hypothetical protein
MILADIPWMPGGCEIMITPSGILGKVGSPVCGLLVLVTAVIDILDR